jgi:cytoskeletal protein RodZ
VTAHGVEPFGVAHGVDSRRARTVVLPDRARPAGSDRSALMVAVGVVGAAVVVGAAFALRTVMLPVSGAPTEPPALASASAATASAPAREPVAAAPPPTASTEPEPSTSAATAAPAAPTVSSHPRPSVPGSSAVHRGCTPPYVIDPTTGRKKWKTECL